jgi:hypothetical protein
MIDDGVARQGLHRVCAHVLGRRRFAVSGRFGLRAGPAGIATPAFGDAPEVLRIAGGLLVREVGAASSWMPVDGSTLRHLAAFAGTDIDVPFDAGADAPSVGDPDEALVIPARAAAEVADWFALAWAVLDRVIAGLPAAATATTVQLWPEHFDVATTVTLPEGVSVNLGFSPGDGYEPGPYVYVGPWAADRPGDAVFWNAPFGASRRRAELAGAGDAASAAAASADFLRAGLAQWR